MIKRLVWFGVGALAGASGTVWTLVRLRRSAARPAVERVASVVTGTARSGANGVRRFVDDARTQVRLAEQELRPPEVADPPSSVQRLPADGAHPGRLTKA